MNIAENTAYLPDFIETNLQGSNIFFKIPTSDNVEVRSDRRKIIKDAYKLILSKLDGKNYVRNDFLQEDIYIIWKESFQKATNNATRHWQSTYSVLKLFDVLKYAIPHDENYRSNDIKDGNQKKNRYVELIKLRYTFNNREMSYMNFTIEVVIGMKNDGKHVQYSLEYVKKVKIEN
ncbi:MAG: hypothetical protein MJZ85_00035 [Bacteroidales bacterium]|nr:hypothetical protein [Bacteroidales bacterium]MCQ2315067.1 hypothetical protein [Bacteroidales bacterium]